MENQIGIYDHETGKNIVRDMTAQEKQLRNEEVAAYEAKEAQRLADIATSQAAKESAQAKLEALGLTTNDLKALGL